jgi:hypothetical protein
MIGDIRQHLEASPFEAFRACFKNGRGPAARDFGRGQGGETGASPLRAVRVEPPRDPGKRTAARRVFPEKALWLRCSSVTERRLCSLVAPRQRALSGKTGPLRFLIQALTIVTSRGRRYPVPSADHAGLNPQGSRVVVWFNDDAIEKGVPSVAGNGDQGATPNGGPASPPDSPDSTKGPPSVS